MWRSARAMRGVQYVIEDGQVLMLRWYVGNWDIQHQVSRREKWYEKYLLYIQSA